MIRCPCYMKQVLIRDRQRGFCWYLQHFPLEVLFLRDDDIPQSVADGIADIGIVGENEFAEKETSFDCQAPWL